MTSLERWGGGGYLVFSVSVVFLTAPQTERIAHGTIMAPTGVSK